MIHFKIIYLDHFRPYYVESGELAQTALDVTSRKIGAAVIHRLTKVYVFFFVPLFSFLRKWT